MTGIPNLLNELVIPKLCLELLLAASSFTSRWTLRTVLTASLSALLNAQRVASTTDDVVTNTRKVANAAAANEDDRVFLKVVPFTRDVNGDFFAIGQTNTSDLPQSRVRLLWSHRTNLQADTLLEGALVQHGAF